VLTLLGARKRSLQKLTMAPIWARRRRLPRVSLAFCGVLSAALAAVVLIAAIAAPAVVILLVGAVRRDEPPCRPAYQHLVKFTHRGAAKVGAKPAMSRS
jgi:hypothetical protein